MNDSCVKRMLAHTDLLAAVSVVLVVTMLVVPLPPMLLDLLITLNISAALTIVVGDDVPRRGARLRVVPEPAAADDDVPPGDQRLGDAPDPHHRRRRPRRQGVRRIRRRRQRGRRPRHLPDPDRDPVRRRHQRRRARRRGRRALHARRDARQADGDRRRPQRRPDHRRRRPAHGARRSRSEADFYGAMDGASKFVKGDAHGGRDHHRHQPGRRDHRRRAPARHELRRGRPAVLAADRRRRSGGADPGAADLGRDRHHRDARRLRQGSRLGHRQPDPQPAQGAAWSPPPRSAVSR